MRIKMIKGRKLKCLKKFKIKNKNKYNKMINFN